MIRELRNEHFHYCIEATKTTWKTRSLNRDWLNPSAYKSCHPLDLKGPEGILTTCHIFPMMDIIIQKHFGQGCFVSRHVQYAAILYTSGFDMSPKYPDAG